MGDLVAVLSTCCFAAANVTIMRGAVKGKDNGAFLSILLTTALSGIVWLVASLRRGWSPLNGTALLWFAAAGVLTIFVGRVFLYASIEHLGAVRASAMKRLSPFFSVTLGVLLLGETLSTNLVIGMSLIFASFAVLVWHAVYGAPVVQVKGADSAHAAPGATMARASLGASLRSLGIFYGPISALAYAFGYVARKQGMASLPDAAFGTMFGCVVGLATFLVAALFIDSYRTAVRSTLTSVNPWLFAAGMFSSAGQIFFFLALSYSAISRVALITSMEVFVTIFLSVIFLRKRDQLSGNVVLAATLGVLGTVWIMWK